MESQYEKDVFPTSKGDLEVYFLGHGSLLFYWDQKYIYLDPFSRVADYSLLPKASLILVTHEHRDHLDLEALNQVRTPHTAILLTAMCARQVEGGIVMNNSDITTIENIHIEAVPAYNLVHKREDGQPFHPKGHGNGYILTFGNLRVYIAADTENIPEMAKLHDIDIAFLPMNLPYTMTPEMVADAARLFMPKILYPYHYGSTNTTSLTRLLKDSQIEVRIRNLA